ncbi:MAG: M3 family metallopeptidase [Gammaproteobacteria bacterium]|nr:M3 family metallopeptidase [Gammaproteobacteria bacterium]
MNALLIQSPFPDFESISAEHVVPAIEAILKANRSELALIKDRAKSADLVQTFHALERLGARLNEAWAPVEHLNAVMSHDALRTAYNTCLPLLSAYETELGQDRDLLGIYEAIAAQQTALPLTPADCKAVANALRDFRLSGVALTPADRKRYGELKQRLSEQTSLFSEHILDATDAWEKVITEKAELDGLPETAIALARQAADLKGYDGYLLDLSSPSYSSVMTHATDRGLRQEVYEAYTTRASELGPQAGQFDNTGLVQKILEDRIALANLLGFEQFSGLSLATKMAESPDAVMTFLLDLSNHSKSVAEQDFDDIARYGLEALGLSSIHPWDVAFCGDRLKRHRFDLSDEDLRPYFPVQKVIDGLFEIVQRIFGIEVIPVTDMSVWHPDVTTYLIRRQGVPLARFYFDLYARAKKRGGAWMADCRCRRQDPAHGLTLPVAFLTCNFAPPVNDQPALLSHDDVVTLFHEFGHGLHHMLTQVDCASVSGINGVAWDAVELPSQFLENWCWDPDALNLISGQVDTGEPLPLALLDKMLQARNFQSGMQMVRQLEFALFDFRLHNEFDGQPETLRTILDEVRAAVSVTPISETNRFQNGFSHIFGDVMGYAAGYYSYKWAEVLSADAFSKFKEDGIFNRQTGERFLTTVLEQGGARDALELFIDFRGRAPSITPLLQQEGIL